MFPVERDLAGLGEVVAGSGGNHAERSAAPAAQDAVGRLVNTAVAAGNDNEFLAVFHVTPDPLLEVANAGTAMYLDGEAAAAEKLANA